MEKKPLISVIVPVYKVEQYLSRCVESVLRQNLDDFELLLVDDGSPDNSGIICDEWAEKDSRIRVFHQKNAGQSGARNTGLDHAAGRYAVFIDSDDYVEADYLENLYCLLPASSAGLGFTVQGFTRYMEGREIIDSVNFVSRQYARNEIPSLFAEQDFTNMFSACAKLYDMAFLNKYHLRFNAELHYAEDIPFILECWQYCDYIAVGDKADYIYIRSKTETISKKVNPFFIDYAPFFFSKSLIDNLTEKMALIPVQRQNLYKCIHFLLERVLKCDYHHMDSISGKTRRENLHHLVDENMDYLKEFYSPAYLIDKIGRFLLVNRYVRLYDLFIALMFRLKVQKMYCPPECF